MRAITLWQPWATFMALGLKRNETRGWSTHHRGALAIHASSRLTGRVGSVTKFDAGDYSVPIYAERIRDGIRLHRGGTVPIDCPFGAVLAIVSLIDVKSTDSSELAPEPLEAALGDYSPGRFAWQTGSLDVLAPIPVRGGQRLWNWTAPEGLLEATRYHQPSA